MRCDLSKIPLIGCCCARRTNVSTEVATESNTTADHEVEAIEAARIALSHMQILATVERDPRTKAARQRATWSSLEVRQAEATIVEMRREMEMRREAQPETAAVEFEEEAPKPVLRITRKRERKPKETTDVAPEQTEAATEERTEAVKEKSHISRRTLRSDSMQLRSHKLVQFKPDMRYHYFPTMR